MNLPTPESPSLDSNEPAAILAALLDTSDAAILSLSLTGIVQSWNSAADRIFGYPAREVIGRQVSGLITLEPAGAEDRILALVREGERVMCDEAARRRKDGRRIDLSLTVAPIRKRGGEVVGALVIARDITEQKRTQEAAAQMRLAIEAAPNGMVMIDAQGRITMVNSQMERLFGYDRSEMIGQPIELLLPERYRGGHPGQREAFFNSPAVRAMGHGRDLFARRKDGSEFPVEVGLNPANTPEGRFVLAAVIVITERKKAEQALAQTAAQFRLAVEAAPNGMVMVDQHGTIAMVNSQMERLFGYARAEMIGQSIDMLLPERYRAAHPGHRNRFFTSPLTRAMGHGRDLYARRKDGTEFAVEVGLNPAETPEGTFVLAAVIDITERKRIEHDLSKSAMQFRLVVEGAPNGMVMVDEEGTILMVNSQLERQFGYDRSELLGQPIEMLLPGRFRKKHPTQRQEFLHSPTTRAMGHGRDLYGRRKDGTEFPVEVGLNPAETPDGTVVLAAVIDITQRKRMEADLATAHTELREHASNLEAMVAERTAHLQQTIAELESVSYSLSHDMRAPLRTIHGFTQIVLKDAAERLTPEEKALLEKCTKAVGRLDRLIQDVLTYTRVSRQQIKLVPVDVEALIRQIIAERPELQPPKAEINLESPLLAVCGHEASLTQAITNLLDNAVKFVASNRTARVSVRTERTGENVNLWIEDNGIGIPEEAQGRLFAIFQRVHDEKQYPGTGIGLAIVRKAVERMGGSVRVESQLGQGSRFCLQLHGV